MIDSDRRAFAEMLAAVFTYYGKDLPSENVIAIYWEGLKAYDLVAIRSALGQHAKNPDTGQYCPKIADVEKMIGGSTLDSALIALHKLETAFSGAGPWRSVVFDDALIHRVVEEMGGWVALCTSKDWTFRRAEFQNRYRGYKVRGETPSYAPRLIGIAEAENSQRGFPLRPNDVALIGDPAAAQRVLAGGTGDRPRIGVTPMSLAVRAAAALQLEVKS